MRMSILEMNGSLSSMHFKLRLMDIFFFSTSLLSDADTSPLAKIVHTDTTASYTVASLYSSGSGAKAGSKSVIIYLEQDDYVSVQLQSSNDGDSGSLHDTLLSISACTLCMFDVFSY